MKHYTADNGTQRVAMTRAEWLSIGKSANWLKHITKEGKAWHLVDPSESIAFEQSKDFEQVSKEQDALELIEFARKRGFDINIDDSGELHVMIPDVGHTLVDKLLRQKVKHEHEMGEAFGHPQA